MDRLAFDRGGVRARKIATPRWSFPKAHIRCDATIERAGNWKSVDRAELSLPGSNAIP